MSCVVSILYLQKYSSKCIIGQLTDSRCSVMYIKFNSDCNGLKPLYIIVQIFNTDIAGSCHGNSAYYRQAYYNPEDALADIVPLACRLRLT